MLTALSPEQMDRLRDRLRHVVTFSVAVAQAAEEALAIVEDAAHEAEAAEADRLQVLL